MEAERPARADGLAANLVDARWRINQRPVCARCSCGGRRTCGGGAGWRGSARLPPTPLVLALAGRRCHRRSSRLLSASLFCPRLCCDDTAAAAAVCRTGWGVAIPLEPAAAHAIQLLHRHQPYERTRDQKVGGAAPRQAQRVRHIVPRERATLGKEGEEGAARARPQPRDHAHQRGRAVLRPSRFVVRVGVVKIARGVAFSRRIARCFVHTRVVLPRGVVARGRLGCEGVARLSAWPWRPNHHQRSRRHEAGQCVVHRAT